MTFDRSGGETYAKCFAAAAATAVSALKAAMLLPPLSLPAVQTQLFSLQRSPSQKQMSISLSAFPLPSCKNK